MNYITHIVISFLIIFSVTGIIICINYDKDMVVVEGKSIKLVFIEKDGVFDFGENVFVLHLKKYKEKKKIIVTENVYNTVKLNQNLTDSNIW